MSISGKRGGQFMVHSRESYAQGSVEQYDFVRPSVGPRWNAATQQVEQVYRDRSLLTMTVEHHPPHVAYAGIPESTRPRADWEDDEPRTLPLEAAAAKTDFETPHPDNPDQPKLFGMHTTPGTSKVDYMVGTREGRTYAMTMLGIAQNRSIQNHGRSLMPSTDLSPHSHKLAEHLSEKAGTKAPPVGGPSNGMGFNEEPGIYNRQTSSKEIDPGEIHRGRGLVKRMIKGGSPDPRGNVSPKQFSGLTKKPKPDPNQGTLF
jgi:hypothetical protein